MANKETTNLQSSQLAALQHWSSYGQPSAASPTRVLRPDGRYITSFSKPCTSTWGISIPASSITKLINGFRPQQMEEKWFICSEDLEDGKLSVKMFRSWTGKLIYELLVEFSEEEAVEAGGKVTELVWESDENVIRSQDEEKAKDGAIEVCRWVLGVKLGGEEQGHV